MLLRRIARPMLAAMFVQGGVSALRTPEAHVGPARPVLDAVTPAVHRAVEVSPIEKPPSDETLIRIDAVVKIVGGGMLAFGILPRVAATALAASLVPTTLSAHRFWEEEDPERKRQQEVHFLKNVGLLGGLLIAAADTEGRPSLAWRSRKAAALAAAAASAQAAAVSGSASEVRGRVTGAAHEATGHIAGLAAGLAGAAAAAGSAVAPARPAPAPS
ncbi:hypothetical protein BJF78_22560 [Pseudonocardia sp. CNS-139]|nr:hypothetical protein BJF78_22560 [Pseudonocardia sp. CNS-139]